MKRLIILISCSIFSHGVSAQLHLDDPNYIYQTQDKVALDKKETERLLTSRQHYSLDEQETEDGRIYVTLIPISNKEFHAIIRKKKRLVREMKGKHIPAYELTGLNGESVTPATFSKARVTVYNFWFTTCHHCIEEIPKLNKIVARYPERVNFIAPTFNTRTQVARFLEENTFDYTILTHGKKLAQEMHIRSYPTHFIADHDGTIQKVIVGSSNHVIRRVNRIIRRMLKD